MLFGKAKRAGGHFLGLVFVRDRVRDERSNLSMLEGD
jgi:hypothetical protein